MSQLLQAIEYRMVLRHNMSQPLHAIEYRMVLTQYVKPLHAIEYRMVLTHYVSTLACYRIQDGANAICPNPCML